MGGGFGFSEVLDAPITFFLGKTLFFVGRGPIMARLEKYDYRL